MAARTTDPDRDGVQHYVGAEGLARLRPRLHCGTRNPAAFRAQVLAARTGPLRVTDWRSNELWGRSAPESGVELAVVLDGVCRIATPDAAWEARRGDLYVVAAGDPHRWAWPGPVHLRVLSLPEGLEPRTPGEAPPATGPLRATALTRTFGGALESVGTEVLATAGGPRYLAAALRGLAAAVLDEQRLRRHRDRSTGRARIEHHVHEHLADPLLTPARIAQAMGVSLRSVHAAFNRGDDTLVRHIRSLRAEAVAADVRAAPESARIARLAAAHGFTSDDQLARAFRARFGTTVGAYAALAAAGALLPQPVRVEQELAA